MEWYFFYIGLQKLGFGSVFCRWVRIFCEDVGAEIIVNGDLTRLIKLFRLVRQGCFLVFYFFVLVTDLFLILVKVNGNIKGSSENVCR